MIEPHRRERTNEFDRPVYFRMTRGRFLCSWCELKPCAAKDSRMSAVSSQRLEYAELSIFEALGKNGRI
jgi:hypothetical protein